MARYHIETYGCTSNRGESRAIESALRDAGHYRVDGPEEADVAIMNSCTVVEKTERNMLRRAKELEQETADLIVTGCMALAQGDDFREEDIDAQILHWDDVPTAVTNGECPTPGPGVEPVLDGVVGILPIARGCMSNCSYCITKFATGRVDSPSVEENVEKARALVHAGAKELRITGQDTGVYGWDKGDRKLPELLDRICSEIEGDFRVRVGMANPGGVHGIRQELADVFAEHDKLYNFIHAPVQSGSDEVLEHMRRQHRVDKFKEIVETFDETLDYWTLSTDFIVGYPTETDEDHAKSMDLLREVHPEKINVTRFSKRPGTDAADLKGLGGTIKKERSKEMSETKMDIVAAAYEDMVGTEHDVLVVEEGTGDSVKCRDEAYRQIIVQNASEHGLEPGDFARVKVTAHQTVYAFGELVETRAGPDRERVSA
ncbi:tRNA (N(6)-L-threonylcarbamoyladenosine(37)-C(2))-methylthiotransferase [Haloferax mediterranei ATCC 33500]|uniref:tRNA-t(6)A37 methylthiotransferase n=1 Tax=Haloferax mediterranei (strain ATCC 33500 / DSM 1411 / JCM 8866 / NBRC 14739 / NCIMB 2177 / R-4) TaxID=523841 RepID=I3R7U1_HALMT|nr:tRNA (N(6)-L-threonylcarbamoyladenosine(37)-C(2))-methylthiotransferase [Haloferax mediterranei]AFK20301.1 MiaB-like tRNA modifying enzyme [Haloferax mediterranei ATCC 33500]AHZ23670.1 tRNA modifying enzyme [Haloferax mediterranei ATCC 33500]ELZ99157.1 MiaB-like tRNA modifying enzyme [Haloferax mediterranei ATCC 33500]MDX5986944.1 tRNA (N(6)-L-threonylcarbamoyladenosine(37)-C(2))-methylthiotransferase [Haloferax mediterranei ATCC 33500]QCQ76263.1 tRNA (N(6)-L-threonylcarbamoyladenosine(37)-